MLDKVLEACDRLDRRWTDGRYFHEWSANCWLASAIEDVSPGTVAFVDTPFPEISPSKTPARPDVVVADSQCIEMKGLRLVVEVKTAVYGTSLKGTRHKSGSSTNFLKAPEDIRKLFKVREHAKKQGVEFPVAFVLIDTTDVGIENDVRNKIEKVPGHRSVPVIVKRRNLPAYRWW